MGGAGPTDSGMLWIEGVAVTVPTASQQAQASPYALKWEDAGYGISRDGVRLAARLWAPRGDRAAGQAVVVVHGFCGSKDEPAVQLVAARPAG